MQDQRCGPALELATFSVLIMCTIRVCNSSPSDESSGCVLADLLAQAEREGASLIVASVYSQDPLAERVIGGVTREIQISTNMSWFPAH